MCSYIIYVYSYAIRMSLIFTRMPSVCHSYVLNCNGMSLVYTRMSLAFTHISSVCHSYVLVCHSHLLIYHPYVTRMYSYAFCMSLVFTHMSSVCHSHVLARSRYATCMYSYVLVPLCHLYVTSMWCYHELEIRPEQIRLHKELHS